MLDANDESVKDLIKMYLIKIKIITNKKTCLTAGFFLFQTNIFYFFLDNSS